MVRFIKNTIFLVFLLLTSCNPATPQPLQTPQLWQVQFTPALGWMGSAFNLCTRQQSGIALAVEERPAQALDLHQADFSLRWGASDPMKGFAAEIGSDELVVIVNPTNPLTTLDISEVKAIFAGKSSFWALYVKGNSSKIQVWAEAEGSDVQRVFETNLLQQTLANPFAHLAPDPVAMRQSVATDPTAIGYLPHRWLDSSVKAIQIKGISVGSLRQPILILRDTPPQGVQKDWLLCVQDSIK